MQIIYLSPHLDDVALSCGGLLWQQAQSGHQIQVWTVCTGDPPEGALSTFAQILHRRWETGAQAVTLRKAEDIESCAVMGAGFRHLGIQDCIYRLGEDGQALYASEEALSGRLDPAEAPLVERLSHEIARALPAGAILVCPLALGSHVDHQLTRAAAERIHQSLWYYADYPYVRHDTRNIPIIEAQGWQAQVNPISSEGLQAWQSAVAAHASQISSFWPDLLAMRAAIQSYCESAGGVRLWRPLAAQAST